MSEFSRSKHCPRGRHRGDWPGGSPPLDRFTDGSGWGCPGILPDGSPCDYELRIFPDAPLEPAELREHLGRVVRDTWVICAREQDDPKPSHLTGWDDLDAGNREVDMRIGDAVAAWERQRLAALLRAAAEHDPRHSRPGWPLSPFGRFRRRHGLRPGANAWHVLGAAADEIESNSERD